MKKVHLRINYGGEERLDMVRKTIIVSAPYFTTIQLVNFGPDINSLKFSSLLTNVPNLSIVNLGKYFHCCITEDLLRHHVMNISDGEWVIWLDSDWRLPQCFLDNIQIEIEKCESEGSNALFSYQLGHTLDDRYMPTEYGNKCFNYNIEMIDLFLKKVKENPDRYGYPILQRVDKSNLWCDSFLGNHTYFLFVPYTKRIVPHMYHYHYRHFDEYAYNSTMLFQSWWYIGHNVFPIQDHINILNSWEYKKMEEFKVFHNCYTANELRLKLQNSEFVYQLKELFLSFKNTTIFGCKQMYNLAFEHNMTLLTTPPESDCNGICCQYNVGKIFNI